MLNVNSIAELFSNSLYEIAKCTIQNTLVTVRYYDKPWFTAYLRCLKRKSMRMYYLFKKKRDEPTLLLYRNSVKKYTNEIKKVKHDYESSKFNFLASEAQKNPKKWWSVLKNIFKGNETNNETISPIEIDDQMFTSDADKANAFNRFFCSVTKIDDSNAALPNMHEISDTVKLDSILITQQEVLDQLLILDVNKSFGFDNVSPRFLKGGANELSPLLTNLFNKSLSEAVFPLIWKKANVVPIHKKDKKSDLNNYRPVSLLSTVAKVFERIIFKHVYNYLRENFILCDNQSGFLPGRSTTTQLVEVYHHLSSAVDKNKEIRIIFLDISKAFDKVWHTGLLYKLQKIGISGKLLDWFNSYLKNHLQRVTINGTCSGWEIVLSGVPQGSVLGPLLFLIYITDICNQTNYCNVRLFALNTCLFIEIDDRKRTVDLINSDLDNISRWARDWLITFSPTKTKSLIISNKSDSELNPPIKFNDHFLEEVDNYKYLGLLFSSDLKWKDHIDMITLRAHKRLSAMRPLKYVLDRRSLQTMYTSFVRPVMEYGNAVWGGSYDSDIDKLERINIAAMRLITGATSNSSIAKLYEETALLSIPQRIENAMLILLFRIIKGQSPNYLTRLLPASVGESNQYSLRNS